MSRTKLPPESPSAPSPLRGDAPDGQGNPGRGRLCMACSAAVWLFGFRATRVM